MGGWGGGGQGGATCMRPMPKGLKPPNPSGSHDGSEDGTVSTFMPLAATPASNAAALAGRQEPRAETRTRLRGVDGLGAPRPAGHAAAGHPPCTARQCSDRGQAGSPAFNGLRGRSERHSSPEAMQPTGVFAAGGSDKTPAIQFQLHSRPAPASQRAICGYPKR